MAKKLLLKSRISRAHYTADACVVWCFDDRFASTRKRFFKKLGLRRVDHVSIAGGMKTLATRGSSPNRNVALEQIATSIRLHHTKRVILMTHSDCGAYGGLVAFKNDSIKELRHHSREQKQAVAAVKKAVPRGVRVESVFVDFEGVWRI